MNPSNFTKKSVPFRENQVKLNLIGKRRIFNSGKFVIAQFFIIVAGWDGLVIIQGMFHDRVALKSMFLLLLPNYVIWSRLKLVYISLIVSIRSTLIHLHDF